MLNFLCKLKKFAIASLILGCIALVVTSIIGSLFFNLDPITVFTWFAVAFVVYFVVLFVIAVLCFIAWYFSPTILVLILAIALILGTCFVFLKANPVVDLDKIMEENKISESFLKFLNKNDEAEATDDTPEFETGDESEAAPEK